ncbi:MAG: SAM-dependent methyltransferase [Deltaproteobacteria bacterium]|nr:SAM-dependent methyltransferase [Deltaproteobacteria bacterium]
MSKFKLIWLTLFFCLFFFGWKITGSAAPPRPGTFFVIGTGPAGPEHATLKAIETMRKADLVLTHPELAKKFSSYLKGKKIEDPWKELWMHQGKIWMKDLHLFKPEERQAVVAEKTRERDEYVKQLKAILAQGKNVALLDGGDPTIYSRAFWLVEGLEPEQVEIIPGVGALAASMAALKKSSTGGGARFVLQTAPFAFFGKKDRDDLARDLSRSPGTLAFYMGLADMENLVNSLKKYNPGNLPVAVVYNAAYPQKEKVVKGTLDNIMAKIAPEPEKWLGMIIVGQCLEGSAFTLSEGN